MLCYNCFKEIGKYGRKCPYCGYDGSMDAQKFTQALPGGSILNGRYIVGRVLGQGGFGITYIAQKYSTKEFIAIKEYLPSGYAARGTGTNRLTVFTGEKADSFEFGKQRFLEEAKTLAQFMNNENICKVDRYFEENGTAYIAMEYLDGVSLEKYITRRGGRLSMAETKQLLTPVMDALIYVHSKGIVHRDIAPDNIIVTNSGTVKLIDFGAARYSLGEVTCSLDVILKHGFAPIEQYSRHGKQGPFTDVYALAATFYYALTGKVPPDAIDRMDMDTITNPSALGSKIGAAEENALMKALSVRAADRYKDVIEFKNALFGYSSVSPKTVGGGSGSSSGKTDENIEPAESLTQKEIIDLINKGVAYERKGDYANSFACCYRAAAAGNPVAQYNIGICYAGGKGVQQDKAKAVEWYIKSAEQGYVEAQYNLGVCYEAGDGVQQDYSKAADWYTEAAMKGKDKAQNNLGTCYLNGNGVEKNYIQAVRWYSKAAEKGLATAQYNMGVCCENGYGLEKNINSAIVWYRKAKLQGNELAAEKLSELLNPSKATNTANANVGKSQPVRKITPATAANTAKKTGVNKQMETANTKQTAKTGLFWHKCMIYIMLFATAGYCLFLSFQFITGLVYGTSGEWLHSRYPALKVIDIATGVLMVAIAVFAVVTRFKLAGFKRKAVGYVSTLYGCICAVFVFYVLIVRLVAGLDPYGLTDLWKFMTPATVLCIVNEEYYRKRRSLFKN